MGARQRAVHGDNAEGGLDSHMALNALESVSDDLDTMTADERRQFVAVVERMAATEDPANGRMDPGDAEKRGSGDRAVEPRNATLVRTARGEPRAQVVDDGAPSAGEVHRAEQLDERAVPAHVVERGDAVVAAPDVGE